METMRNEFLGLSDYAFGRLEGRLESLTDEEYFWEAVPDCWTIRSTADGTFQGEWGILMSETPPITTIAWRLVHIIDFLTADRCPEILVQDPVPSPLAGGAPRDATTARSMLKGAYEIWRTYVSAVDDEFLSQASGPAAGIYAEYSRAGFVLHIVDELIHHGAEVSLLRDLYRAQQQYDPEVSSLLHGESTAGVERIRSEHPDLVRRAAAEGRWGAVEHLLNLGFSIDSADGRNALHHAAAVNNVDAMQLLLDRGASTDARDPVYNATPLEWAEYFHQTEAAEVLRARI